MRSRKALPWISRAGLRVEVSSGNGLPSLEWQTGLGLGLSLGDLGLARGLLSFLASWRGARVCGVIFLFQHTPVWIPLGNPAG